MPTPPNLLYVFTDEQRLDTLACYGNEAISMPNLNRFAASSCVVAEPHCCTPVCTPSRGCMMTGVYPFTHGAYHNNVPLNTEAQCLPELLAPELRSAYRMEYHGKWHLGDEIFTQHGFDQFLSIEDIYIDHFSERRDRSRRSTYHHWLLDQGYTLGAHDRFDRGFSARLPEPMTKAAFLANTASQFIREHQDEPWALVVSLLEPHMPFYGPRDRQYPRDEVRLPSNVDHDARNDPALPQYVRDNAQRYYEKGHEGFDLKTDDDWLDQTARYWGLNSMIDEQIGRIIRTVSECGLDDNTIIVFTSDHGDQMGSHRLLAKGVQYKESLRVPLLVKLPGQSRGCRITSPVSHIDLLPTLLDLMGQAPPSHLHGRSLAPLLSDASQAGGEHSAADAKSPCVSTWNVPDNLLRTLVSDDGWRFTWSQRGEHELYDLTEDPDERRNLAAGSDHLGRMKDMTEQIAAWQDEVGDELELTTPAPFGG